MSISVCLPFHPGDRDQALRLIEWIQFLGPTEGRFFLMTQQKLQDPAILPVGWEWLTDHLDIKANWKDLKDASAANAMWTQAAREMTRLQAGPWLWLEPDAVPLTRNWLSALSEEYRRGGRPFMGGHAPKDGHERMSGVAVYEQNTSRTCRSAMLSGHVAFDYFGAEEFKRLGVHFTPLICDQFRCDSFKDQADFDARVPMGTVLHHGDKSGSIYQFLPARLGLAEYETSQGTVFIPACSKFAQENVIIQRVPDAEDPITDMLRQRQAEQEALPESFPDGMRTRLDWIIQQVGDDKKRRAKLYEALQAHGIECGRKKRKQKAKS